MPVDRKCCLDHCAKNSVSSELKFHKLPRDEEVAQKWKENLRLSDPLPKLLYVCGSHFKEEDMGRTRLKRKAVPTLNLGYEEEAPHQSIGFVKRGRSCCIQGCSFGAKAHLFMFPKTEVDRNTWAEACNLPLNKVANKIHYICERHFEAKYICQKRLLEGAFPKLYLGNEDSNSESNSSSDHTVLPEKRTFVTDVQTDMTLEEFEYFSMLEEKRQRYDIPHSNECLDEDVELVCDHERFAIAARQYQNNASKLRKRIEDLENEVKKLNETNTFLQTKTIIAHKDASADAIVFAKMILGMRKSKYTEEEKNLAQNINYMSSKAYAFMRDDLGFRLPHKRSLLGWRPIRYVPPGINDVVISNLRKLIRSMPESHRICQIMWDEISIKKDLAYNNYTDVIDGFVDNGEGQREMLIGDKCLFFMIKGICSKWKYVLSYYISQSAVNSKKLLHLITENIQIAQRIGLNVKAAICDQGSTNQSVYRALNIDTKNSHSTINGAKIHFMYDYCHLIKSVRNNFLNYHEIHTRDGTVRNAVVKKVYSIDKENDNYKMCPKLTEAHVYPNNFEKMKVSRATQLFSNSVSAAIGMLYDMKLLGGDENLLKCVKPTQIFIKKMNDLFDEVDCKFVGNKNPIKQPMFRASPEKMSRLLDHIAYLKSISFANKKYTPCIDGFILTLNSMISLSEDILESNLNLKYVLLGKLNQDALENFFYKIRASQGINVHPSAHDIQYIVARLMSMKILRHRFQDKGNNCEDDDDVFLDWNEDIHDHPTNSTEKDSLQGNPDEQLAEDEDFVVEKENAQLAVEEDLLTDIPDELFIEEVPERPAELQIQRYYTGYTIYQKVLRKIKCQKCTAAMMKAECDLTNVSEALIRAKNYCGDDDLRLVNPNEDVFQISKMHMQWYVQYFNVSAHKLDIKKKIKAYVENRTKECFPKWFAEEDECAGHRSLLLDYMITVLLFKNAKWLSRKAEDDFKKARNEAKLRKLNK